MRISFLILGLWFSASACSQSNGQVVINSVETYGYLDVDFTGSGVLNGGESDGVDLIGIDTPQGFEVSYSACALTERVRQEFRAVFEGVLGRPVDLLRYYLYEQPSYGFDGEVYFYWGPYSVDLRDPVSGQSFASILVKEGLAVDLHSAPPLDWFVDGEACLSAIEQDGGAMLERSFPEKLQGPF